MNYAGGIAFAGIIGALGFGAILWLSAYAERELRIYFGIGGHWAHETRQAVADYDAADGDDAVVHGVVDGAETTDLTSGKGGEIAGAAANG